MNCLFALERKQSHHFSAMLPMMLMAVAIVFVPATAHADTYINYDIVDATFASGATLTGTFTIDVTPGDIPYGSNGTTNITAANFTVTEPDSTTINLGCPTSAGFACIMYDSFNNYTQYSFIALTNPSDFPNQFLVLGWPIDSPTDSFSLTPGAPNVGSSCYGCVAPGQNDFLVSGMAIDPPPNDTPEPGTGLLLLCGLGGAALLALRRSLGLN